MIWILGGTSEAVELARAIKRDDYVVTVTTYAGLEQLKGCNGIVSKMGLEEMVVFIEENSVETVVDMSHPFAYEATKNSTEASRRSGVKHIRYVRESSKEQFGKQFSSLEELKRYISTVSGNVFFTTGINTIEEFESVKRYNRFIYRVLPTVFSLEKCVSSGVKIEDIVAAMGPYTVEFNMAMFRNYGADFVVMKDSGSRGGTSEKIEACRRLGIEALILSRRDQEVGISDIGEILEMID